jgi:hypothetical protein
MLARWVHQQQRPVAIMDGALVQTAVIMPETLRHLPKRVRGSPCTDYGRGRPRGGQDALSATSSITKLVCKLEFSVPVNDSVTVLPVKAETSKVLFT